MSQLEADKIILVNPFSSLSDRYGLLAFAGGIEPPFGLCYLAAQVRRLGYKVEIVDAQALKMNHAQTIKRIIRARPQFVGFTACTPQIKNAAYIAQNLKQALPSLINIIGGPHISSLPELTMQDYPCFDIGVIGEGEMTLCSVLDAFRQKKSLSRIAGLICRDGKELFLTKPRPRIDNLDRLAPPAFELLPYLPRYYRVPVQSVYRYPSISLVTSRGCPGRCIFCDRSVFGNDSKYHSAGFIMDIIRELSVRYGIKSIMFEDDIFVLYKDRLYELLSMLGREKNDLRWACNAKVGMVEEKLLQEMKKAGCWQILYGIESGSQKILDFLNKNITLEQIEDTIQITKRAGILTKGFIMFGNPQETKETLQETIDFISRIDMDDISITYFTPYPGSEVFSTIEDYGQLDKDWSKMNCFNPVFLPRGLDKTGLEDLLKRAYKKFYFRKKIMLSHLENIKGLKKLWICLVSAISLLLLTKKSRLNVNQA